MDLWWNRAGGDVNPENDRLIKIVRLRFGVTQINAQFSVSAGASADAQNIGGSGVAVGSAGGEVGYSDYPTLTNKGVKSPISSFLFNISIA